VSSQIIPLRAIDARYEPLDWDFSRIHRAEIDRRWAALVASNPHLFNGTVLMQHRWDIRDGVYHAAYGPVDYASFLVWREMGFPGSPRRNGFAMAALQSTDNAFVLGVMGAHTANAGRTYFPGGTPDMSDVTADGRVDLTASMTRELYEETGLRPDEVQIDDDWVVVLDGMRAAFLKPARVIYDGATAQRVIEERLATMVEPELSGILLVRSAAEIDMALTPPFAADYMLQVFSEN
jgi:8-oxo-dGTP pyrophosphatase MutT (NUDIX family)